MTLLQWHQVAAPDYGPAISGLGAGGENLNKGFQGLSAAIGANKARQGEEVSNNILLDMANIYSEDQIPSFVENVRSKYGDKLQNLTPEVQKYLADPRQIIIANQQRRDTVQGTQLNNLDKANDIQYLQGQRQQNAANNSLANQAKIAEENGNLQEAQRLNDEANRSLTYTLGGNVSNAAGGFSKNPSIPQGKDGAPAQGGGVPVTTSSGDAFNVLGINRQNIAEIENISKNKDIQNDISEIVTKTADPANSNYFAAKVAEKYGYKDAASIKLITDMIDKEHQKVGERQGNFDTLFNVPNENTPSQAVETNPVITDTGNSNNVSKNTIAQTLGINVPNNPSQKNVIDSPNKTAQDVLGINQSTAQTPSVNSVAQTPSEQNIPKAEDSYGVVSPNEVQKAVLTNPANAINLANDAKLEAESLTNINGKSNEFRALDVSGNQELFKTRKENLATMLKKQSSDEKITTEVAMGQADALVNNLTNQLDKKLKTKGVSLDKNFLASYILETQTGENWFRSNGILPNGVFSDTEDFNKLADNLVDFKNSGGLSNYKAYKQLEQSKKDADTKYLPQINALNDKFVEISSSNPASKEGILQQQQMLTTVSKQLANYTTQYRSKINDYNKGIQNISGNDFNAKASGEVVNTDTSSKPKINPTKEKLNKDITSFLNPKDVNNIQIRKEVNLETKDLNNTAKVFDKIISDRKSFVENSFDKDAFSKLSPEEQKSTIEEATYNNDTVGSDSFFRQTDRNSVGNSLKRKIEESFKNNSLYEKGQYSVALKNPEARAFFEDIRKMSGKEVMSNAPQLRNRLDSIISDIGARTKNVQDRLNKK